MTTTYNESDATIDVGADDVANISGSDDTVYGGAGSTIRFTSGVNDVVYGSDLTVADVDGGVVMTVTGTDDTVRGVSGDSISLNGTEEILNAPDDTITLFNNAAVLVRSAGDTINADGGNISVELAETSEAVTIFLYGSNDAATGYASSTIAPLSSGWTGDWINIYGSQNSGTEIGAYSVVDSYGSDNTANLDGANDSGTIYGASDTGNVSGTGAWMTISSQASDATVTLNGSSESSTGNSSSSVAVFSNGWTGDWINLSGNADVGTENGSNSVIDTHSTNDVATLNGSNDSGTIYGSQDTGVVNGNNSFMNVASGASSDTVSLTGSYDTSTVAGSNSLVEVVGSSDVISVTGSNDVVNTSTTQSVTLLGSDDLLLVSGVLSKGTLTDGSTEEFGYNSSGTAWANGASSYADIFSSSGGWLQRSYFNSSGSLIETVLPDSSYDQANNTDGVLSYNFLNSSTNQWETAIGAAPVSPNVTMQLVEEEIYASHPASPAQDDEDGAYDLGDDTLGDDGYASYTGFSNYILGDDQFSTQEFQDYAGYTSEYQGDPNVNVGETVQITPQQTDGNLATYTLLTSSSDSKTSVYVDPSQVDPIQSDNLSPLFSLWNVWSSQLEISGPGGISILNSPAGFTVENAGGHISVVAKPGG